MKEIEKRLNNLEYNFTLQEELLVELNEVVTKQEFIINSLNKQLKSIKQNLEDSGTGQERTLEDDIPPHY